MPKYVIERALPGAGKLSNEDLHGIAKKSAGVVRDLGPDIQWVETYVTGDKLFCVYNAKNADIIREHAKCGGFPCDAVLEVKTVFDPTWAEAR